MLNKLPNGDSYSTLMVNPVNWMSTNAPMGVWYIQYRYYYKDGESKQVLIKGMNRYKDRIERQRVTLELLQEEEKKLQNVNSNSQIPLIDALNQTFWQNPPYFEYYAGTQLVGVVLNVVRFRLADPSTTHNPLFLTSLIQH